MKIATFNINNVNKRLANVVEPSGTEGDGFRISHRTFWDYKRNRWQRDAGLRIDHLLLNPKAAKRLVEAGVDRDVRGLSSRRRRRFSESIYFSINTISTVGYGDIIPYSNLARVLSSLEVFCGIMLLLFGVSELLEYAREHRRDRGSK